MNLCPSEIKTFLCCFYPAVFSLLTGILIRMLAQALLIQENSYG